MHDGFQPEDQWIERHYARIHRGAWLLTGDAWSADDLAQETFLRALEGWSRFSGRSEPATWLYGILIRLHRQRCRGIGRAAARLRRWWELSSRNGGVDPATAAAQCSLNESLWRHVRQLPADQRETVLLRFGGELSYQDVAEALECPVGTVRSRLHYALETLRIRLGDDFDPAQYPQPQRPLVAVNPNEL